MSPFLEVYMIIIGILCLLYYLYIGFINGFNTSFLLIWLLFGIISIIVSLFNQFIAVKIIKYFIVLLICGVLLFTINIFVNMQNDVDTDIDYLIVLGAAQHNGVPSDALMARIKKAYEYYVKNNNVMIVTTGGKGIGETISEGECTKNILLRFGVNENNIFVENKSETTVENIKNSLKYIDSDKKIAVVSSDYHLFRAKFIAKCYGLVNVYGIGSKSNIYMLPHNILREFVVFCVDLILGNIKFIPYIM